MSRSLSDEVAERLGTRLLHETATTRRTRRDLYRVMIELGEQHYTPQQRWTYWRAAETTLQRFFQEYPERVIMDDVDMRAARQEFVSGGRPRIRINLDEDPRNADWTKWGWHLPPYKSPAFFEQMGTDLATFRTLPIYQFAVERGWITDDEWTGPVPPDGGPVHG